VPEIGDNPDPMTWLGFVAAVIQAVAWPLVILTIAVIFHSQIKGLMSEQLRRFKAGPVEIEWERQVVRVETLVEPVPTHLGAAGRSLVDELGALASEQPGWAVLTAYDRMAEHLRAFIASEGLEPERPYSRIMDKVRATARAGRITPEIANAVEGMTSLRNLVAHGRGPGSNDVTPERATQYLALADAVIFALASETKADS